jgi:pimeloyl-ACP methyl ester carboxylesterase
VPSLVLAGDRDLLVSPQSLQSLCNGIDDCREVRLERCGHLAFVTHPDAVARAVGEFLSHRDKT